MEENISSVADEVAGEQETFIPASVGDEELSGSIPDGKRTEDDTFSPMDETALVDPVGHTQESAHNLADETPSRQIAKNGSKTHKPPKKNVSKQSLQQKSLQKPSLPDDGNPSHIPPAEPSRQTSRLSVKNRKSSGDPDPFNYRHFQSLHPTTNKILSRKWEQIDRRIHHEKLAKAKSTVDSAPPKSYGHLQNKSKKLQIEEDRQKQIDRDNKTLMENMTSIMRLEKKLIGNQNTLPPISHNVHAERRQRQQEKVNRDNLAMLDRLERRESFYDHSNHLQGRRQTLGYLRNISAYPRRFMEQEQVYAKLTETHGSHHRPGPMAEERRRQLESDWRGVPSGGVTALKSGKEVQKVRFPKQGQPKGTTGEYHQKVRSQTPKLGISETDSRLLASERPIAGNDRPLPDIQKDLVGSSGYESPEPTEPVEMIEAEMVQSV
ncbi:KIAA1430-like protein-domain-containing protein [Phlyctochytrium arcticum]|nr:KIAA1430-like protein-domain-containing protein [Phlyctochytrium arcticum]